MPSTHPITHLPFELIALIRYDLTHTDLLNLVRTSRFLRAVFEPFLWQHIELHYPNYHEDYARGPLPHDVTSTSGRNYIPSPCRSETQAARTAAFLATVGLTHAPNRFQSSLRSTGPLIPQLRVEQLASYVRSLCLTLLLPRKYRLYNRNGTGRLMRGLADPDTEHSQDPWSVFAQFVNLESLELIGGYQVWENRVGAYRGLLERGEVRPSGKLRRVRLRGYFPREFVRWTCANPEGIEDLELGVLDVPIGGFIEGRERENPPGAEEEESELGELLIPHSRECTKFGQAEKQAEGCAPRPLAALLDTGLIERFTSLKRLSLIRPVVPQRRDMFYSAFGRPGQHPEATPLPSCYLSVRSAERILEEWSRLIVTTRGTVEELVLDQRLINGTAAHLGPGRGFVSTHMYATNISMSEYERVTKYLTPALLDTKSSEWPALRSIGLYGFDPPEKHPYMLGEEYGGRYAWLFDKKTVMPQGVRERFPPQVQVDIVHNEKSGPWMAFMMRSGELAWAYRRGDDDGLGHLLEQRREIEVEQDSLPVIGQYAL